MDTLIEDSGDTAASDTALDMASDTAMEDSADTAVLDSVMAHTQDTAVLDSVVAHTQDTEVGGTASALRLLSSTDAPVEPVGSVGEPPALALRGDGW